MDSSEVLGDPGVSPIMVIDSIEQSGAGLVVSRELTIILVEDLQDFREGVIITLNQL